MKSSSMPRPMHSKRSIRSFTWLAAGAALLTGCADPALVQVSPNAYRIVKSDKLHFYRTTAQLKAEAVRESNDFANERGKLAVAIATSEQPLVPGVEFATVKYHFRLIDKSDPEAHRMSVSPRPIVLDKAELPVPVTRPEADIVALDEMRQRGIVSPAEFAAMKARLLAPAESAAPAIPPVASAEPHPVKP